MNDIPKIKVCDCKFEDCWAMITLDYDLADWWICSECKAPLVKPKNFGGYIIEANQK
jgi:hypothetical protein